MWLRLWRALGDLRLAFWLLLAAAVCMLIGGLYASDKALFSQLNRTALPLWLDRHLADAWHRCWWLVLLLLCLSALGINTAVCALQRLRSLWPRRRELSGHRWAVALLPTAIHILFLAILAGHAITLGWGSWQRLGLPGPGGRIEVAGTELQLIGFEGQAFPPDSRLGQWLARQRVRLRGPGGDRLEVVHLKPASFRGRHLLLDRPIERRPAAADRAVSCDHAGPTPAAGGPRPSLLVVHDPGLPIILPAFGLVLILLVWFYVDGLLGRRRRPAGAAKGGV